MEYMRDWFHTPLGLASPSVFLRSSPGVRGRSKGTTSAPGEINFAPWLLWPSMPRPDQLASLDKHDEFFAWTMDCKGLGENRQDGPINLAPPWGKTFRPATPESIHSFMAGSRLYTPRLTFFSFLDPTLDPDSPCPCAVDQTLAYYQALPHPPPIHPDTS